MKNSILYKVNRGLAFLGVLALFAALVIATGCGKSNLSGTYRPKDKPLSEAFIYLHSDSDNSGSFTSAGGHGGRYVVNGDSITLQDSLGGGETGIIQGNELIFGQQHYVKN